jgi:Ca-activated chloride channel family protein
MIELWPHWARPGWLAAWPVLAWLCWALWLRRRRSGRWQALLPRPFHRTLLRGSQHTRAERGPRVLLGLAALLAGLALAGPGWEKEQPLTQRPNDPLVILLELTPDMLARDASPDRLGQARRKILDLLQHRADAQTAIVVYAGSAHTLVPLSDDLATSSNLLQALKPSLMPEPGQRADLAVGQALDLLAQAGQGAGRLLLITSSVTDLEHQGIDRWLGRQAPALLVLGMGTPEGAPVTLEDGELLKDANGGIVLPRLDAHRLAALASQHHGRYETARLDNHDLRALGLFEASRAPLAADETPGHPLDRWADQGYWLLLPLLLSAALAGRRGWLLCLPVLLTLGGLPTPAQAGGLADLWWRPDQQGRQLLDSGQPAAAARHFHDTRWQGVALYRAGQYDEAAKRFAQADGAVDHYNRGNALAMAGHLEAAVQAYEQALERQPSLKVAADNQALVKGLLDARSAQSASPQASPASAPATPPPVNPQPGPGGDAPPGASAEAQPATAQPRREGTHAPGTGEGSPGPSAAVNTGNDYPEDEARESLEQWLRQIPDDPSELLRRKFWYEQQQRQEQHP